MLSICCCTALLLVPPVTSLRPTLKSKFQTSRTSCLNLGCSVDSSLNVNALKALYLSSAIRTAAPATWCVSRKGTPLRTKYSAKSVASISVTRKLCILSPCGVIVASTPNHGAPDYEERRVGSLGNIEVGEDGSAKVHVEDKLVKLIGPHSIIGRSLVVHEGEDYLGKGGHEMSLQNGNAGAIKAFGCCGHHWNCLRERSSNGEEHFATECHVSKNLILSYPPCLTHKFSTGENTTSQIIAMMGILFCSAKARMFSK
ncbi:hypothetical protein PsorP6_006110 [Peronosclerospora sorghi]|uniref:Uncharacterized protein n=1 Tax=Peronosclerospora sorghi TaxID=230839 RepID=A0ACC0W4S1_9STRA|nr:hypothetical protein PsorP6_006110 [Peronosclerospora sorghi]